MKLSSSRRARPNQQMLLRLIHVLPAAALLLAFAATPLHTQDSDDGLLRRGDRRPPPPGRPGFPPMPPTSQPTPPAPQPTPETAPLATTVQGSAAVLNAPATHRARVIFTNGLLEVRADNSSLLQVLHDISRITGLKITGGITEQQIFGDYGPASPATVLATLLDGSGANMLLSQDPTTGAPVELVLSQRAGAGNPVSPNGPGFDDSPFPSENPSAPLTQATITTAPAQSKPDSPSPATATQKTVNATPTDILSPPPPGLIGASNPPAGQVRNADGTTSAATPESIYQQLMQLKQAKAAAQATAPAASAAPGATPPAPAPSTTPH